MSCCISFFFVFAQDSKKASFLLLERGLSIFTCYPAPVWMATLNQDFSPTWQSLTLYHKRSLNLYNSTKEQPLFINPISHNIRCRILIGREKQCLTTALLKRRRTEIKKQGPIDTQPQVSPSWPKFESITYGRTDQSTGRTDDRPLSKDACRN